MADETRTNAATPLVYLDVDDEITSAAARIRATDGDEVALVLPYGSRLATSRINFRLLAREASERGKQIEIVCADPSARALAAAAGLPVYPSVAAFEGHRSGVAVEVPGGNGTEASAAAAIGETEGAAAAPGPFDAPGVAGPGVAGVPVGGRSIEDDTQTRVLEAPRHRSTPVPRVGPPRPPVRTGMAVGAGLAAVMLVLVGGILALELLPSATVVLAPRSEEIGPIELTIIARPDVTSADPATLTVPAERVPFSLEASHTVTATGTKVTEIKSTGNVTFSNFDAFGSRRIDTGEKVATKAGIEFSVLADVVLPAAGIDFSDPFNPRIIPSTSSVGIEAVLPGDTGNVNNNTITVLPKGTNKDALDVTNPEATTGGSRTEGPEIIQADIDTALLAIDDALAEELGRQVADGIGVPAGITLFAESGVVGEPEFATDPQTLVGSATLEVELIATAEGSVLGVDPSPIEVIAEARLEDRVSAGWSLAPGSTAFVPGTPSVLGESVSYPVTITATQVRDVDQEALADQIRGLVLAEARSRLDDFGDVEITLWPDWVTTIPKNAERITFTLDTPRPAPTPAP